MTNNNYSRRITGIEQQGTRRIYHVGPRFEIEAMTIIHDPEARQDLMNVWKRAGLISKPLGSHIAISTYYTDEAGNCWGRYNCTEKASEDGKRRVINFDFLREATPENEAELVAECIRRALEDGAI